MSGAALMSAVPVVDKKDGYLQVKNMNGSNYIKLWDPNVNGTIWQPVPPNVEDLVQIKINGVILSDTLHEEGAPTTTSARDHPGGMVSKGEQVGLATTTTGTTTTSGEPDISLESVSKTIGSASCHYPLPLASATTTIFLIMYLWL